MDIMKSTSQHSRRTLYDNEDSELEDTFIIEERLKSLLSENRREWNGPKNIFIGFQASIPKLRRSVIVGALEDVITSTPMTPRKKRKFFYSQESCNISPINGISASSENRQHNIEKSISYGSDIGQRRSSYNKTSMGVVEGDFVSGIQQEITESKKECQAMIPKRHASQENIKIVLDSITLKSADHQIDVGDTDVALNQNGLLSVDLSLAEVERVSNIVLNTQEICSYSPQIFLQETQINVKSKVNTCDSDHVINSPKTRKKLNGSISRITKTFERNKNKVILVPKEGLEKDESIVDNENEGVITRSKDKHVVRVTNNEEVVEDSEKLNTIEKFVRQQDGDMNILEVPSKVFSKTPNSVMGSVQPKKSNIKSPKSLKYKVKGNAIKYGPVMMDSNELPALRRSQRQRRPPVRRIYGVVVTSSERVFRYYNGNGIFYNGMQQMKFT